MTVVDERVVLTNEEREILKSALTVLEECCKYSEDIMCDDFGEDSRLICDVCGTGRYIIDYFD